ncbi:MAG: hypothetical protein HY315_08205 [Acidobacteria bacterium]|nr:hypothetical protein [Acidobacteriota bacterium]
MVEFPCQPLAYLITIRCYGTWLHGEIRGSVTRFVNRFEVPHLGYLPELLVLDLARRRRWARHGSRKYLWTELQVREAIHYVLEEQGSRMKSLGDTPTLA